MTTFPNLSRLCRPILVLPLIAVGLLSSHGADLSASYAWKPIKIGGGGFVTGIVMHPDVTGLVYVRTDVGGSFRWDEPSKSWVRLMAAEGVPAAFRSGSYYNVESIAVDKLDSQVVYMACGAQDPRHGGTPAGVILKSTNRGATWQASGTNRWFIAGNGDDRQGSERLAVDPANSQIVYFGSRSQGMWRSQDAGATWSLVPTSQVPAGTNPTSDRTPSGVKWVLFDPSQGTSGGKTKRIYVGVAGEGIYRSDDAGSSFAKVWSTTLIPFDAELTSAGVLWCGVGNGGASVSGKVVNFNPATNQWKEPTPTGDAVFNVAIDPNNENRVFVSCGAISNNKLARTTIGADTQYWTFLNVAAEYPDIQWPAGTDELNFMSVGDIKFDPKTANRLWFAQGIGVWRSSDLEDSEVTWTFVSQGIEEFIGEDIVVTPSGRILTAVADRLGFKHADPDADPGPPIIGSYFSSLWSLDWTPANPQFVAAVESDVRPGSNDNRDLWVSFNNGDSWAKKTNPMNHEAGEIAVSAGSANNMVWVGTGTRNPWVTLDGGSSWAELTWFGGDKPFRENVWWSMRRALAADRVESGVFYLHLPSGEGDFYRSSNSGQTWERAGGDIPTGYGDGNQFNSIEAVPGRAGHVWGCFNQGGLHYTTNKGDSWTKVSFFNYARSVGFGKAMNGGAYPTVFVYGNTPSDSTYALYRSTDQGATWDKIATYPLGIFDQITRVTGDFQNEGRVYVALGGQGFAYGTPSGASPALVSQGKTTTASSQESAGTIHQPSNATDGNASTRWASAMGSDPQWIMVDLGSSHSISRVELDWETAAGRDYKIQASQDGSAWTDLKVVTGNTTSGKKDYTGLSGTGQYVRVLGTARATQWGYSLWAFDVYGTPSGASSALVSQGKTTTASSQESVGTIHQPSNATDGNASTRWASAMGSDPQWIMVDLGSSHSISRVELDWETAAGRDYKIQASQDGSAWTDLKVVTGNTTSGKKDYTGLSGTGRYVRVLGTARATQWGYSLWAFDVYGSTAN